jgi:hypothetical protein
VREKEEKVEVRQIIIPLPQFETHISLAEATTREKYKKPIIKVILTTQLFKKKVKKLKKCRGVSTLFPLKIDCLFNHVL